MLRRNIIEETCSRIIHFANKRALKDGFCIHSPILKSGIQDNLLLINNLLSLYAKCCGAEHARNLFDEMPLRDVVSWTAVLSAYVKDGNHEEALSFFDLMKLSGEEPNAFTFSNVLRSCCALGDFDRGTRVHASLIKHGFGSNAILCSSLIEFYSKRDMLRCAVRVFNGVANADSVSWTSMISSLVQAGKWVDAVRYFIRMIEKGVSPNEYTFMKILVACGFLGIGHVKLIHSQLILWGVRLNLVLKTALLDAYAKCREMEEALKVLKQTSEQDVRLWNTVIAGLAAKGLPNACFLAFLEMRLEGQKPDSVTLSTVLQACGTTDVVDYTRKVHGFIIKTNADHDLTIVNALVDAYAGVNMADSALRLVKGTSKRNVATYTVLASKLNRMGSHELTLEIINHIWDDDLKLDGFAISTFLSASANLGAIRTGKQLHCYSTKSGFGQWMSVSNGLIDFYGKSQCMVEAQRAFEEACKPDTVSWNALIHSFALNECTASALSTLEDMRLAGAKPDSFTLMTVLNICNQGGLVDMAFEYFDLLRNLYDVKPRLYHYALLVDLLGRAGRLEEAVSLLKSIPFRPNALIYKRLLIACKLHKNMLLAEEMAMKGLELDPCDLEFFVILGAIYDEGGRSDLGDNMRSRVKEGAGLRKSESMVRNSLYLK